MNEVTFGLFRALRGAKELDEEQKGQVFSYLSALVDLPGLGESEKANAAVLLDFLEGIPGGEVFAPLFRTARCRLSLVEPKTWAMDWPENYAVEVDGQALRPEELRARGIEHVDFTLTKPIRNSVEYTVVRRLHSDGTAELLPQYQVFDAAPVGERHMFSVYGEKAVARDRAACSSK